MKASARKKRATSTASSKARHFSKYARKLFSVIEEPTDMFHPWSQKHIFDYNQAIKEEILAAGDV